MKPSTSKDWALLLLRLAGLGLAFAHGWAKVGQLAFGDPARQIDGIARLGFPMPGFFAWCAALAECAGGLLVALGLFTRVAASLAAFTMFVAAFLRHKFHLHLLVALGLLSVPEATVDSWGNPEKALLYLLVMVALVLAGGGQLSLDHWHRMRRR
jgi:putative oxidoreductase